jgi:hypothetical protein
VSESVIDEPIVCLLEGKIAHGEKGVLHSFELISRSGGCIFFISTSRRDL